MGFSVSGAAVIVFLGIFIGFGMAYTAANNGVELINDAYEDSADDELTRQNTAITITDAVANDAETTLSVTIDNIGSATLSVHDTDILIDGKYTPHTKDSMDVLKVDGNGDTDLWLPGETLHFEYDYSSEPTPARVKVVTESGVSASANVEVV